MQNGLTRRAASTSRANSVKKCGSVEGVMCKSLTAARCPLLSSPRCTDPKPPRPISRIRRYPPISLIFGRIFAFRRSKGDSLVFYPARAMICFHLYTGSLVRGTHGTRIRTLCGDYQEFEICSLVFVLRWGKYRTM